MNPRVEILLSTFNPCWFLDDLVQSLQEQDYPSVRVTIRDDGSTDAASSDLVRSYAGLPGFKVTFETHVGVVTSFLTMLSRVADDVDYVAFCDQDDVWMPDKVSRAVTTLERTVSKDVPGLYCSRYAITDEKLSVRAYSIVPRRGPSFSNALVQNIAAGFTIVLNRAARRRIAHELPRAALMHDWWCYLVVSALGRVVYDPFCSVLYRQHSANLVGERIGVSRQWAERITRFLRRGRLQPLTEQACELMRIFGQDLASGEREILHRFIFARRTVPQRLIYSLTGPVHRQSFLDDLVLRALIAINRV